MFTKSFLDGVVSKKQIPSPDRKETFREILTQISRGSITQEVNARKKHAILKEKRTQEEYVADILNFKGDFEALTMLVMAVAKCNLS